MARKMTEWPSKRGPITKIMPSDGCIGDTVRLAVGKWYDFHEFGWYMGNVGLIEVTDSGTGIPHHEIDKVFDPFFTTKGPGKGSGLGLSMVYGFVKQSRGHVTIDSEQGQGTTVRIYMPRSEATAEELHTLNRHKSP